MADIILEVHNLRHTLTGQILPPVDIVDRLQECLHATPGSAEEPEIERVIRAAIREIRALRKGGTTDG